MSLIDRAIEALLPSQKFLQLERDYIQRTGKNPTFQQEKRWKKDLKKFGPAH